MQKIKLVPGMSKAEFEKATGLTVEYRTKGKTGISFKCRSYSENLKSDAEALVEDAKKRFEGCKVTMRKAVAHRYYIGELYSVQIVVPLA